MYLLTLIAQAEPDVAAIAQKVELFNVSKIATALTIIAIVLVISRVSMATLERLGEGQARRRLLFKKVQSFTRLGLFIMAAYMVVLIFFGGEEENKALIGLGGTLAVAIGFALKDTLSSLMAGILILIDQPFQVGDRVAFGSTYGEVKEIGLRSVRIITLDDSEVSIPNNKFLTEEVSSANAGALDMMVVIQFRIAPTEDFDLAKHLIHEAVLTSRYVFLHKPVVLELKEEMVGIICVTTITARAYVIDARYELAFVTDVTERAKRAFRKHGIRYPHGRQYNFVKDHEENYPADAPGASEL
jgi:small conductance mechanosensitive channel